MGNPFADLFWGREIERTREAIVPRWAWRGAEARGGTGEAPARLLETGKHEFGSPFCPRWSFAEAVGDALR